VDLPVHAPNPSPVLQFRFDGVLDNVPDGAVEFISIADQAVIVLSLPELTFSSERLICCFRGKALPGFDDLRNLLAGKKSRHNVNVIGHDAPGEKPVALSLAEAQGRGHSATDAHVKERTRADATVEVLFNARVAIIGEQCLLLRK